MKWPISVLFVAMGPEEAISRLEFWARIAAFEDCQLLSESEILKSQITTSFEE
jgi:hypothetical protein